MGVEKQQFKEVRTSKGKRQYNLQLGWGNEPFMMLPSDMALWWCPKYRQHVQAYDRNRIQFRKDAAMAWKKLTELAFAEKSLADLAGRSCGKVLRNDLAERPCATDV